MTPDKANVAAPVLFKILPDPPEIAPLKVAVPLPTLILFIPVPRVMLLLADIPLCKSNVVPPVVVSVPVPRAALLAKLNVPVLSVVPPE